MKYKHKITVLSITILLMLIIDLWMVYKNVLPLWQSIGIILFFFVMLCFFLSREGQAQEDVALDLGSKLVEAETRRLEAENFILNSGDEEAIRVLERAKAYHYSYIRILSEGNNTGNETLTIALGILSGICKENAHPAIDNDKIPQSVDKIVSDLFENPLKK